MVEQGDSLYSISQRFGVTEAQLIRDNQLYGLSHLVVGQALLILTGEKTVSVGDLFSYGFTIDGVLIPPAVDDLPVIRQAWRAGAEPVLVLTPFDASGAFNNYLVRQVVENKQVQDTLIANLLQTVEERGYMGVDVDFEFILPEDRVYYAEFVGNLREVMNRNGYKVSVALAPKVSADQRGLLYEGIDYRLLGENSDQVLLMTYEWGYTYGPPMAVAPINKVRQVLDYAVQEIPAEKILMGVPNYGYDWPLPFERGVTEARTIGNVEAVLLAAEYYAEIRFDETAQTAQGFITVNLQRNKAEILDRQGNMC